MGQPRLAGAQAERHAWQQRELSAMIAREFSGNAKVKYIDLADAADLGDGSIATDGLHLSPDANATVAARLVGPVREMLAAPAAAKP